LGDKKRGFIERKLFNYAQKRKGSQNQKIALRMSEGEIETQRKKEVENFVRQAELEKVKMEREKKLRMNEDIKLGREQMMENISALIIKHIFAAELYISTPTEGASLFNESNFKRQEWNIQTTSGYSSTMPLFIYTY
jgi:hypothetical protein